MHQQSMSREMAVGDLAIAAAGATKGAWKKDLERLTRQGLKGTVMHEIGHTLGLRHNFKGSTMLTLDEVHNRNKTSRVGVIASVMDYDAVNLATNGQEQGDYYTTTLGPYDMWAIEYGYKPLSGGTKGELDDLKEIASRSGEENLAFATDEDTRGVSPDPYSNRHDLGKEPIEFAKHRAELVRELLPDVVENMTKDGEDYSQARRAFNVLLGAHGRAMFFAARMVGGVEISRSHKGDKDAPPPYAVVPAEKQREALELLMAEIFGDAPFQVDAETLNYLGASRWNHWGAEPPARTDFPIHDVVLNWQQRTLDHLLSSLTLERLHDSELKVDSDEDALTTAELLERLTDGIFEEIKGLKAGDYTNRKPAISSFRRNLQREYMKRMGRLALGKTYAPEDCQSIAFAELTKLSETLDKAAKVKLDSYSSAHLMETNSRVKKILESRMTETSP